MTEVEEDRVAVLTSGSGWVLQALLDAGVPVGWVVVDRICGAVDVAARNGIGISQPIAEPGVSFVVDGVFDIARFTDAVMLELTSRDINVVILDGFDTALTPALFEQFEGQMLVVHYSLLPSFYPSPAPVKEAWRYGVKVIGCTLFIPDANGARGEILAQEAMSIRPADTAHDLYGRLVEAVQTTFVPRIQAWLNAYAAREREE